MVCEKCGVDAVGFFGPPICSDCAFPQITKAMEHAVNKVSEDHFKRTGENIDGKELMRRILFR